MRLIRLIYRVKASVTVSVDGSRSPRVMVGFQGQVQARDEI